MRKAIVYVNTTPAGILEELGQRYRFTYLSHYDGEPISLTMPISQSQYEYEIFPPFFEGLLPEGILLDGLLRKYKLDRFDYFGQLLKIGSNVIGAVSIVKLK